MQMIAPIMLATTFVCYLPLVVGQTIAGTTTSAAEDKDVLISIRAAADTDACVGPFWDRCAACPVESWNPDTDPCGEGFDDERRGWIGVMCGCPLENSPFYTTNTLTCPVEERRVVSVDLSGIFIGGELLSAFGLLGALVRLDLSGNPGSCSAVQNSKYVRKYTLVGGSCVDVITAFGTSDAVTWADPEVGQLVEANLACQSGAADDEESCTDIDDTCAYTPGLTGDLADLAPWCTDGSSTDQATCEARSQNTWVAGEAGTGSCTPGPIRPGLVRAGDASQLGQTDCEAAKHTWMTGLAQLRKLNVLNNPGIPCNLQALAPLTQLPGDTGYIYCQDPPPPPPPIDDCWMLPSDWPGWMCYIIYLAIVAGVGGLWYCKNNVLA